MTTRHKVLLACFAALLSSCGGSQPEVRAADVCAVALSANEELRAQATKLELEPEELARQVCASALLGAQLIRANVKSSVTAPIAGAPNEPDWLPLNLAGAAGI